jgi:hypothetical protein
MPKPIRRILPVAALAAIASVATIGCHVITEPSTLRDFQWVAVEHPDEVTEGIDVAAFAADIDLLGQLKTPTLCYNLVATFDRSGSDLTIHVDAKTSAAPNCQKTPGGYRYTAALRGLGSGSYTVHVVHTVEGVGLMTFSDTAEIH